MGGKNNKTGLSELLGLSAKHKANNAFVERLNICNECYTKFGLCSICASEILLTNLDCQKRCPQCKPSDEGLFNEINIQWEEIVIMAKGSGDASIEHSGSVLLI